MTRGRIPLKQQMRANVAAMRAMATTPEQLARIDAEFQVAPDKPRATRKPREGLSELQHQIRVIAWWDRNCESWGLLPLHLFHIPNGGSRGRYESQNLKRSGVRPGILDLFLAVQRGKYHGLFVEMKDEDGKVSPDQERALDAFELQGYKCVIARGHQEAIASIGDYIQYA